MEFTLQPVRKDGFINRESVLNEMISTLAGERLRIVPALACPRRVAPDNVL